MPAAAAPLFLALSDEAGRTVAVLPCQRLAACRTTDRGPGAPSVASLTSFYSCDFRPLIAPGEDVPATAFALGRAVRRELAPESVVRLDSLESTAPFLEPFVSGLSAPGRALLRYEHFGRWWEDVGGKSFDDYLGPRNGGLREIIRRKGSRLRRDGATIEMTPSGNLARGIADYEAVYLASWKPDEPFPDFQPLLMRRLAAAGWLRLAICRMGDRPIAAQLWVVTGGRATVLKLAHDQAFDRYSPGTVLTAHAIRMLMEDGRVKVLDFGRGDDPYKRAWASQRTPHIGILSASIIRRPSLVVRHLAGSMLRRRSTGEA